MQITFYIAAVIMLVAAVKMVTCTKAVGGALYMTAAMIGLATVIFTTGAYFAAVLVVLINAGAIIVLILFLMMLLHGRTGPADEKRRLAWRDWAGAGVLSGMLLLEMLYIALLPENTGVRTNSSPADIGVVLFGKYMVVLEMFSMLLLAALVGALHLAREEEMEK